MRFSFSGVILRGGVVVQARYLEIQGVFVIKKKESTLVSYVGFKCAPTRMRELIRQCIFGW